MVEHSEKVHALTEWLKRNNPVTSERMTVMADKGFGWVAITYRTSNGDEAVTLNYCKDNPEETYMAMEELGALAFSPISIQDFREARQAFDTLDDLISTLLRSKIVEEIAAQ